MATPIRRQKYFVERGLQTRFTRFVVTFVLVSAAVTALVVFYTTFTLLGEKLAAVYPQGRLVAIFRSVHLALLINLLILVPVIVFFSIRFSHRIAGPLPKIYQALQEIGNGNFDIRVVLRKKDELQELGNAINDMAQKLKDRAGKP